MVNQESAKILMELGLTQTEARVYTTLLALRSSTARNIHTVAKVARQDVYQLLSDLQEKGLIEKLIGKPAKFQAIPPSDAIAILTQKRNENTRRLEKRAVDHFKDFEEQHIEASPLEGTPQFVLLPKSEASPTGKVNRLGRAIDSAQESVMHLTALSLFMKFKFRSEKDWKNAVKRNVKLKFILYKEPNEKPELALDSALEKSELFEIRWITTGPPACMLLVDEKEVFYRIGRDGDCPVLWSTNSNFVALSKDYFKMKWDTLEKELPQERQ
ncbi:MAG: TrmB family transcriptional regulator [Candidatus Bathyarchaeia archaeon]